ncbi:MAG: DUF3450 domain-containing protein [Pseudomonadota bacterium]
MITNSLKVLALSAAALAASGMGSALAQTEKVDAVVQVGQEANRLAQQSQQRVDQISDETQKLLAEYRKLSRRIDDIRIYNAQLSRQVASQQQEIARLDDSINNVDVIRRQITPEMIDMVNKLEAFIKLDIPFRRQERLDRVAELRSYLDSGDISPAEQFRQILETLQAEAEYGRTIENYRDVVPHNGQDTNVEVLRMGRVALLYKAEGSSDILGMWDKAAKQWTSLDSSYAKAIEDGLRFAKKQATAQLLVVPVSAPENK